MKYARACAALVVSSALPLGCHASQGDQMRANLQEMKEESTASKLFQRGRAFAATGDSTRAEQYFAAAISMGGDERVILPMLLTVCIQDGRYRVAIEYASTYLQKHPMDVPVRMLLGTLYSAIGDATNARRELDRVLEARLSDADAH